VKSELSFLMDLFLSDEVPTPIKKQVADRIRDVEGTLTPQPMTGIVRPGPAGIPSQQSPSMQRIMAAHPDVQIVTAVEPQTPAAAEALAKRANIINARANEKPEPGRTSPRKF
jgi:hypothetical protein